MGDSMNNDMDYQMESFFDRGVTNPGSTYIDIGIFLIIVGVIFILIGAFIRLNKNSNKQNTQNSEVKRVSDTRLSNSTKRTDNTWVCICGKRNDNSSNICGECGRKRVVEMPELWKCSCGNINRNRKYCSECGMSKETLDRQKEADNMMKKSTWICECMTENSYEDKFCAECGKPKPAEKRIWICECGKDNNGKFCRNCGKERPNNF